MIALREFRQGDEPALRAVFEYVGFEVVEICNAAMRKVLR
jgi:hypothetical protein